VSTTARVGVGLAAVGIVFAAIVLGYGLGYSRAVTEAEAPPEPLPAVRPPSQLGVPNIIGESLEDAAERLNGLEFDVGFRQPPSGEGTGLVAEQEPTAGTIVERGSLIVIVEGER